MMNTEKISEKLSSGGYYFPIEVLKSTNAINLGNYYKEIKKICF